MGALPRDKVVKKLVVTKLWVNGRATENWEEWCEEVRSHCEKCYDDKSETSEKQAERIRVQRCRGDSAVAIQGRRVQITVNRVPRARGKMVRGKSNGPADCLVVEMLSRLSTEVIYEVTHWFQKRFQGDCRAPEAWHFAPGLRREARRQIGEGAMWFPFDCFTECIFQVVHYGVRGFTARGEGADRVDESARGS